VYTARLTKTRAAQNFHLAVIKGASLPRASVSQQADANVHPLGQVHMLQSSIQRMAKRNTYKLSIAPSLATLPPVLSTSASKVTIDLTHRDNHLSQYCDG
jgi:hypothetical protein